jgi:hypothetical protein
VHFHVCAVDGVFEEVAGEGEADADADDQALSLGVTFHPTTGAETEPPRITPARGPPLWDGADAQMGDGVDVEPDWDDGAQLAPEFEVDQRIRWVSW